jgi:tetratricopeptide (TPR) repeat protein
MNQRRKQAIAPAVDPWSRYAPLGICVFLALAVAVVFGQTLDCGFVNYDDLSYVVENPPVKKGFTEEGIGWAMTATANANWHPLTWLSHMTDCQLYGLNAGGHHLTSVLLHAATAILLFLLLRRMTGDLWPSAFVAAVFAVHPLHVESVAWVAERKDVLSGLFFVLTLWAYLGYVRHAFSWARYLTLVALFALGLMAKPMLVTLPFVLLLLDYWPLRRVTSPLPKDGVATVGRLIVEKTPLFLLSLCSCVVTSIVQNEALARLEKLPLPSRLGNAVFSYAAYLGKSFWPTDLSVFYPHPGGGLSEWKVAAALLVLTGISVAAVACRRRSPYFLVGWLWYLGMLAPVIGLVQVGAQAMADRYTYLPQIGLCIALTWTVVQLTASWSDRGWILGSASVLTVLTLLGCAWHQTIFWRDTPTLWTHALQCDSENAIAHIDLADYLAKHEQVDEAIEHFHAALRTQPDNVDAHVNLGAALVRLGRLDEAMAHYQEALKDDANCREAHYNLGVALARQNRLDEAITQYEEAIRVDSTCADAHANLGVALELRGRIDEALPHYRAALKFAVQQDKEPLAEKLRAKLQQFINRRP